MATAKNAGDNVTLPETNSKSPENRPFNAPKGNESYSTIHFQVQAVSFREGS